MRWIDWNRMETHRQLIGRTKKSGRGLKLIEKNICINGSHLMEIACLPAVSMPNKSMKKPDNKASPHLIWHKSHLKKRHSSGAGSEPPINVVFRSQLWN